MNKVNRIVLGMCLLVAFSAIPDAWGDGFPCPVPAYLGCGFLYTGGTFSSIKFPGADLTFADGINDAGQIVGNYTTAAPGFGSFLYNAGTFSTISFPGAGPNSTLAHGINDAGQIVGSFFQGGDVHGFVDKAGTFSTIIVPGAGDT